MDDLTFKRRHRPDVKNKKEVKSEALKEVARYYRRWDLDNRNGRIALFDASNHQLDNGVRASREEFLVKSLTSPNRHEPCLTCPLKNECRGGCFGRAAIISGDMMAPDPLCTRVAGIL